MTDKEKIREEFNTRLKEAKKALDICPASAIGGMVQAYENVLSYIDSLPKEPIREELEEAAIEYCGGNKGADARVRTGFIMGANWQKKQLMKELAHMPWDKAFDYIVMEAEK